MDNQFREETPTPAQGEGANAGQTPETKKEARRNPIARWIEILTSLGLGESLVRVGTSVLFVMLVIGVVALLRTFYNSTSSADKAFAAGPTPTPEVTTLSVVPVNLFSSSSGIRREANLHTTIPDRPRTEVVKYAVQEGDTIIGIAEKFGLDPETILYGNYYTLKDDPHNLRPGQELNILPVNGTYYQWQPGDGLSAVAKFFDVAPEDIVAYTGNNLDPNTIGDYAAPNISPGTWLIVPGGKRFFISWSAPVGITRDNPADAQRIGAGSCGKISGGAVGYGTFVWPTNRHYLSGFDYSPATNHFGIDLAGKLGEPVYASDAGVIVYAGWNDHGYGNMIVVDHGGNWQTLYAHLSSLNVVCGMSVGQGELIGAIGSTGNSSGPHLHYEMMHSRFSKVNPWDFLPPP